jgi:hypothetical protein
MFGAEGMRGLAKPQQTLVILIASWAADPCGFVGIGGVAGVMVHVRGQRGFIDNEGALHAWEQEGSRRLYSGDKAAFRTVE